MALGYLDDSKLYAIASAIRAKTGDSATMTVDDMPDEIGSISTGAQVEPLSVTENGTYSAPTGYAYSPVTVNVSGGGGGDMGALIDRTISGTVTDSDVTSIGSYAFAYCMNLTGASFANATWFGSLAFAYCYSLQSAYIPSVTTIQGSGFYKCSSLRDVVADSCTVIQDRAFDGCSALSSFNAPNLSTIRGYAFTSCGLVGFSASNVTMASQYAFYNCKSLMSVSLAKVQTIGSSCFIGCNSLSTAFLGSKLTRVSASAFCSCWRLTELHLESVSTLPNLQNSNAFTSTPIGGFTSYTGGVYGSIFVPSSMYNTFSAAANWSLFKSRMVSV